MIQKTETSVNFVRPIMYKHKYFLYLILSPFFVYLVLGQSFFFWLDITIFFDYFISF